MSGIVERLRAYRPRDEWGDPTHHSICDEAADEIERLARELSTARRAALLEAAEIAGHPVYGWKGRNIAAAIRAKSEEARASQEARP